MTATAAASRSRTAAGMNVFRRLSSSIIVCLVFLALTIEATKESLTLNSNKDAAARKLQDSAVQSTAGDFEQAAKDAAAEQLGSSALEAAIDIAFSFRGDSSPCYAGNGDQVTEACGGNCCVGENACSFTTATVCEGSCNGKESCAGLGEDAVILPLSCSGLRACFENSAFVLFQSCLGNRSCRGNTGFVSFFACRASQACMNNAGVMDAGACNAQNACENNQGNISALSCSAKSSCKDNTGNIGDIGASGGFITNDISCTKVRSCRRNSGNVGENSCLGTDACLDNSGEIGDDECVEDGSCTGNTEDMV